MATGIVDYLLKTGRAKLQTHKCYDFLEVARPDFDLVAVEKILDKFHLPIAKDERLLLCYRFREAPAYLEEFCNPLQSWWLRYEIDEHLQQVENLTKELIKGVAIKEGKNDHIYRDVFEKSLSKKQKINLHTEWKQLLKEGKIIQKYDAFRKGYNRWCKKNPSPILRKKNWPSKEFFRFVAAVSVHYVVHDQSGRKEFFLLKSPNTVPKINQILKLALGLQCIPNRDDEAKRVEKIKKASKLTNEEKEAKLRRLATRNNIHAIQCLLEREGNSDELTLRAAMLMPNKYGEGRQWEGKYCNLPQLEPYHHFNTIRTRNMEWIGGSKVIPAKTIVRKISFNVNPHSEEWLKSKLAKRKLSLSPYSDARNKCDQTSEKCVIENPSPHDFDEIMKIGKIIGNIELVFTSGLKLDCYNEINTTIHLSERQYAIHALYDLIDKLKDGDREALPPVIREKLNSLLTEAEQNAKSLSDEEYRKSL